MEILLLYYDIHIPVFHRRSDIDDRRPPDEECLIRGVMDVLIVFYKRNTYSVMLFFSTCTSAVVPRFQYQ